MLYGYIRVSSFDQVEGTSLREQERVIRGVAQMRGIVDPYDVVIFCDRGVSGSVPLERRPAGKDMMASLRKGDVIVVSKLDRIFRSMGDSVRMLETFKEREVDLIIIDLGVEPIAESLMGKMMFYLLANFADFERGRINERTRDGRKAKKKAGGCVGTVPFGHRKRGAGRLSVLEPDPAEQKVLDAVGSACQGFATWSAANHDRKDASDQIAYVQRKLVDLDLNRDRAGHAFRRTQIARLISQHYAKHFQEKAA